MINISRIYSFKLLRNLKHFNLFVRNESVSASPLTYSSESLENTRNIRQNESVVFDQTYRQIKKDLSKSSFECSEFDKTNKWLLEVMDHNVPHGKKNRGLLLVLTYNLLKTNKKSNDDLLDSHRARVLGWCVELFQTYFLIIDDIMDQSITRRGQSCWYKVANVGLMACNDAAMIESAIYDLIKLYFGDKSYYVDLLEFILEASKITTHGQCLDLLSNPTDKRPDLNTYTIDKYSAIVKYKTSFYTFVLPVRLALYLSEYNSRRNHTIVEPILLSIGHLFQAQDDFLDCFGDSTITGKIGTDIEDGKCCWPIITALHICDNTQRRLLEDNYGRKELQSVNKVKQIYELLNLRNLFKQYERSKYEQILRSIDLMKDTTDLTPDIFNEPLSQVYNRNK